MTSHDTPPHLCEQMEVALGSEEYPVVYSDIVRQYGLSVYDGPRQSPGGSILGIDFCPFCGIELPPSLRLEWFAKLDELGLTGSDEDTPPYLNGGDWWRRPTSAEPRDNPS